jgi:hypothetical protein
MNQGLARDAKESGIFPREMMARAEDEKVHDPTCLPDVDLRMTRTEWTIYWKMKYETTLAKIIEAGKVIDGAKVVIDGLKKENMRLKKMADDLNGQIMNLQAQRQQEIAKELKPKRKK